MLLCLIGMAFPPMQAAGQVESLFKTDLPTPTGSGSFGHQVAILPNGNIVVADRNYGTVNAANVGAVYLYDGETLALISTLTGSNANDFVGGHGGNPDFQGITVLSSGDFVVSSPGWDGVRGAVTWVDGVTGLNGTVSEANSLVGPATGDAVGTGGIYELDNGNYLVSSPLWDAESNFTSYYGAVTWIDGAMGTSGVVSSVNSMVGSIHNSMIGTAIHILTNGNYLMTGNNSVTWGNGATGTTGTVSTDNSLMGSTFGDGVGYRIVLLNNGNYVVNSPSWDNGSIVDAGAVTWGNGATGTSGMVSSANSLVGIRNYDNVGFPDVVPLANGNYVVASMNWNSPTTNQVGAATWGNGTTGTTGIVSALNSLVGNSYLDLVGHQVIDLSNGNYVVASPYWNNGAASDAGSATWGDGNTGIVGTISADNSLVSTISGDKVGRYGVVPLPNGNYLVRSPDWDGSNGAVTWGDGTTGISGEISAANSLVGEDFTCPYVGFQGFTTLAGVTVLSNGNYVVSSPNCLSARGAVTWGNADTGISGVVSAANSLVGNSSSDQIGRLRQSSGGGDVYLDGIIPLNDGNYLVASGYWDNGSLQDVGAITWMNGSIPASGVVTAANSLIGNSANDMIGTTYRTIPYSGITELSNGKFVVASANWDNGGIVDAGAVTFVDGPGGFAGNVVTSANSLVGSFSNDYVGSHGVEALPNGHYVARSGFWNNLSAGKIEAGALTWGSGVTGITGVVSSANSLVGSSDLDRIGAEPLMTLSSGDYIVNSPLWDNGANANAGAITWGNGAVGTAGLISNNNSVLGLVANQGSSFSVRAANNNQRLVVGRDLSQIVTIVELQPRLIVYRAGTGSGTITSDPPGIDCGTDCTELYDPNTLVTLTATPAPGSTFDGWSGACTGPVFCIVTMDEARNVTAHFTADVHLLSVSLAGTGGGTVTSDPPGINCGADCTEMYNHGTVVTLTATPTAGSIFDGWSGACAGLGACIVTMDAARSVTATFTASINTYLLTVVLAGDGVGTVTSDPPGIDCGTDCTESYNAGTVVTLTATPAGGSTFAGWSGACAGMGSCVVTMSAARTVAATFVTSSSTYLLTVIRDGSGTGTVTSSPAGIHCGADCTESYDPGTVVTLSATPAGGSFFAGWSGPCSGQGSCLVTMDAAKTVIATFTVQINTYLLTVSRTGDGTGLVTSNPIGINCGADCTESYTQGTLVTLSATSTLGSTFAGWSGACTGQGSCYVVMDGARNVTATFIQASVIKLYLPTMTRP
jgi:hypothetical protein